MTDRKSGDASGGSKKDEHKLLISKIRSDLSRRKNRLRSAGDLAGINIDSIQDEIDSRGGDIFAHGETLDRQLDLDSRISEIRARIRRSTSEISEAIRGNRSSQKELARLREDIRELQVKERLRHVITRVNEDARRKLFESERFASLFTERSECDAVILSIDIRRSTELMLRAVSPELYAEFVTALTEKVSDCITGNFGIYEQFTGDGVIAFFPDFYSGDDALLFALNTAAGCHDIFAQHFAEFRDIFSIDMADPGFGIGVDCGNISITSINGDLSIVGAPVVYACRYSIAPAGKTYLTERAYACAVNCRCGLRFNNVSVAVKHEGEAPGFELADGFTAQQAEKPDWDRLVEAYS